jgi:hypothetical protein
MYHREIYLSSPQKTKPEELRTVLRFQTENKIGEQSLCGQLPYFCFYVFLSDSAEV